MSEVENTIEKLKSRFRVKTDAALALRLLLSRSTIANWRNRGTIPSRYVLIANGEESPGGFEREFGELNDIERAAMQLAALRFVRDFSDIATDYSAFLSRGMEAALSFRTYWSKACADLTIEMHSRDAEDHPYTVAQILAYNEVFAKK